MGGGADEDRRQTEAERLLERCGLALEESQSGVAAIDRSRRPQPGSVPQIRVYGRAHSRPGAAVGHVTRSHVTPALEQAGVRSERQDTTGGGRGRRRADERAGEPFPFLPSARDATHTLHKRRTAPSSDRYPALDTLIKQFYQEFGGLNCYLPPPPTTSHGNDEVRVF